MKSEPGSAETILRRLEILGRVSDEPGRLTRTFGSPAMRRANELVARWMRTAGMTVRQDAIGNVIGHFPGLTANRSETKPKILLLGSHLDTVRDAGRFDGPLGVVTAIEAVAHFHRARTRLPFAIEVAGFADEEGVRFQSTYLGSRVLAGTFARSDLKRRDAKGIPMAKAIREFGGNPAALKQSQIPGKRLLGYVELHIEQGPVLEERGLALGVVSRIAGQSRVRLSFTGRAGHAGTTPMNLRRDALCGAAYFISGAELLGRRVPGLVATVGELTVAPGASNVIPGSATVSLDVRHARDQVRRAAVTDVRRTARRIARNRGLHLDWKLVQETSAVACDPRLTKLLSKVVRAQQKQCPIIASGAGHDAAAMAACTPVAMLFVRCRGGVSHHPDESVTPPDTRAGLEALTEFLEMLALHRQD